MLKNRWYLVYKWSVIEKQVTSSYKWLPVFTLLTICRLGLAINLDMPFYSHKSREQSAYLKIIINVKFYLMTGAHNFFRLYALVICDQAPAQRNDEDFAFVAEVPHSNNHTLGTANWQNHDRFSPQSVIILHCHVCLGLSNPYISSALWRQCKVKTT